jgi:ribose-phosphate pyrophosphokinase
MNDDAPMLFALQASRGFGQEVGAKLGVPLAPHEEREFEDGEHKARPLASVRDRDVYVLHSLYGEPGQSANDKLCRMLFFIAALQDAGAARVTAVVPYLAYARKDRRSQPRDPVTTRYVACLFEAVGVDGVLALDVHNPAAFQNAFRCRTEELEACNLFVDHFVPLIGAEEITVVAPDAGGVKRAERFRQRLEAVAGRPVGMAFAEKHRSRGVVSGAAFIGDVAGRTCIVVDDLIAAGTTIVRTAEACRARGAARVFAAATHGVFAAAANTVLATSAVERIVVTDSVPPLRATDPAFRAKLAVVGVAGLVAEAIRRLHEGGSIVALNAG